MLTCKPNWNHVHSEESRTSAYLVCLSAAWFWENYFSDKNCNYGLLYDLKKLAVLVCADAQFGPIFCDYKSIWLENNNNNSKKLKY